MFKLDEEHLQKAKEFAVRSRKRKSCNKCYDRGYIGITPENTLVLCTKCVDSEKALSLWKDYVKDIPALKDYYSELFEAETETEE